MLVMKKRLFKVVLIIHSNDNLENNCFEADGSEFWGDLKPLHV